MRQNRKKDIYVGLQANHVMVAIADSITSTTVYIAALLLMVAVALIKALPLTRIIGDMIYMSPNIDIRYRSREIDPKTYPTLKDFIDKYGTTYRHLEIRNIGERGASFWVDSCKYINETGEVKERNSELYPMNYNMQIPLGETRIQIPALWNPDIELEKTPCIIWRIKCRDIGGFRYCSCRLFKSKDVGVYTQDGEMWHKNNISWLTYRKCRLFGGCLYNKFPDIK